MVTRGLLPLPRAGRRPSTELGEAAGVARWVGATLVKETMAIQSAFREKRDRMLSRLERIGVRFDRVADGTFYAWDNVANLPAPLNDGMGLFRAALTKKVIVVPGEFFDVNPGKRRQGRASRFRDYVRFSFGPSLDTVERALTRLEELVANPPPAV